MSDAPSPTPALGRTRFTSEMEVRPDDLDMFQHVHSSRYLDYVLAARYDQMQRCYGLGLPEFLRRDLAWFQRTAHIEFKRPLRLGDRFRVTTWVDEVADDTVRVDFEIRRGDNDKMSCSGHCHYTLVKLSTGRAENIPDWVREKYVI